VPCAGRPFKEVSEASKHSLSKIPGRLRAKRSTMTVWRDMGWKPVLDGKPATVPAEPVRDAFDAAIQGAPKIIQNLAELREVWNTVSMARPVSFLEIGSAHGGTLTAYAAACAPGARIVAVDDGTRQHCRRDLKRVIPALRSRGFDAQWVRGNSTDPQTIETVRAAFNQPVDFLHIDGGHTYECVKSDWTNYGALVRPGGLVAFHDACTRPGKGAAGVARLWGEIRATESTRTINAGIWKANSPAGIGVVYVRPKTDAPVCVFTPFGHERSWAVDLWRESLVSLALPPQTQILALLNSDESGLEEKLTDTLAEVCHFLDAVPCLVKRIMPRRESGRENLHQRMADIWREALPYVATPYLLSLESDIEAPQDGYGKMAAALIHHPEAQSAMCRVRCRRTRKDMPQHTACTLFRMEALNGVRIPDTATGPLDQHIMTALGGNALTLEVAAKHHTSETESV